MSKTTAPCLQKRCLNSFHSVWRTGCVWEAAGLAHAHPKIASALEQVSCKRVRQITGATGWGEQIIYRLKLRAFGSWDSTQNTVGCRITEGLLCGLGGAGDLANGLLVVGNLPVTAGTFPCSGVVNTRRHSHDGHWRIATQFAATFQRRRCYRHQRGPSGTLFSTSMGEARGNPGPGGSGAVIVEIGGDDPGPEIVWMASISIASRTTNKIAGYRGVIVGLRYAVRNMLLGIHGVGDSNLIITQLRERGAEILALQQGKHDVHAYAQRARSLVSNIVTNPIHEATKVVTVMKGLSDGPVETYLFREHPSTLEAATCKMSLACGRLNSMGTCRGATASGSEDGRSRANGPLERNSCWLPAAGRQRAMLPLRKNRRDARHHRGPAKTVNTQ
ncbi:hypothetical protein ON010_g65 [Phytophthora cinnamomi]|nr:hypothetical protein ON010_g65 [Phytophthora cinnamomi]